MDKSHGADDNPSLSALTPLWLQSTDPLPGASTVVTSADLRYTFPLLDGWSTEPDVFPSAMQIEHVYEGRAPGDWLVVSFMAKAVPGHNMLNWVQVPLTMFGFPSIQLASKLKPTPELLAWNDEGSSGEYMEKLQVEEMHGFTGLGRISDTIARVYVLMLRKATFAWMFFLSLQSHAGGGNELVTLRDDHRRAGMIFGNLGLALAAESAAPKASSRSRKPSAR
jgi:hypothetical protein